MINTKNRKVNLSYTIIGKIDCADSDIIWEFKCTTELKIVHFIQLAIYALMYEMYKKKNKIFHNHKYYLYNIFTKEKYEILFTTEELLKMVEYLIEYKLFNEYDIQDSEFINECSIIKKKYNLL
jgi:hypothetical protein